MSHLMIAHVVLFAKKKRFLGGEASTGHKN